MTKPVIRKNGDVWQVIIRDRTWNTRATFADALKHGNRIAMYARAIRMQRDIQRIQAAPERLNEHRWPSNGSTRPATTGTKPQTSPRSSKKTPDDGRASARATVTPTTSSTASTA